MPDKNDVPLMYRSQIEGRCQLHRIYNQKDLKDIAQEEGLNAAAQYSVRWVDQWLESATEIDNDRQPENTKLFQSKEYTISWRFVTNGGKDDGIIRPLIAASGLPFYPGSSMKGAFRAACKRAEDAGELSPGTTDRYCGKEVKKDSDAQPGILRFHGGYPVNEKWQKNLLDVVHPQQKWQVRVIDTSKKPKDESAFALISLYQPTLKFGISCSSSAVDWDEIWGIWEQALGYGIGCRVSCGYGLADRATGDILYRVKLHGTGAASKLLNRNSEFRPNIFRAALRGHALRIFSGLNPERAEDIVDELFGGIRSKKERVGLLGMAFHQDSLHLDFINESDVYDVEGDLIWLLLGKLENSKDRPYLKTLVENLTRFAMLLGGFGKSWRRADHRIFHPNYTKHIIGCHWNWGDNSNAIKGCNDEIIDKIIIEDATKLIEETIKSAKDWMKKRDIEVKQTMKNQPVISSPPVISTNPDLPQLKRPVPRPVTTGDREIQNTKWRETWEPDNVQVWGRIAKNHLDSQAIHWLHISNSGGANQPHHGRNDRPQTNQSQSSALQRPEKPIDKVSSRPVIYRTALTGRLKDENKSPDPTQIGRLWHRMYPLDNNRYLELITIFPKGCMEAKQLINWLSSQSEWKQVWYPTEDTIA